MLNSVRMQISSRPSLPLGFAFRSCSTSAMPPTPPPPPNPSNPPPPTTQPSTPPPLSSSSSSSSRALSGRMSMASSSAELMQRFSELARDDARAVDVDEEAGQISAILARKLRTEMSSFKSLDITQILAAAAKLNQRHAPLLEAAVAHVLRGMVSYPNFALCNVANNLGRLNYRHRQLMDALATFLSEPKRASELSPVDIASLVFAYAQVAHHPQSCLLEVCGERLKDCWQDVGGPNCAIILNSYSRLGECNPQLFGFLSRAIVQTHPESFEVHHISLIMNAYAKCQVRKPQMMHLLAEFLVDRVQDLSPQNVSNTIHAFSRLNCYHPELFHRLNQRLCTEDLWKYKLYELSVLTHNLTKLKSGGQRVYGALFGNLASRPPEDWEPKAVASTLDALRRKRAFCDENLLALLFRRFLERLEDYAVHPCTQASWCIVELDALDLAKDLPEDLLKVNITPDQDPQQGNWPSRQAMRRVLERLEELSDQQAFTSTQRLYVQQLLRSYHYRHELDHGLLPQKVKSFCKAQFDVSTSVVSAVARG